jgi:hypothetical protein
MRAMTVEVIPELQQLDDPARVLIHDDQDPVGPPSGRFAPEQIDTPEAVLQVSNEGQPGWTTGALFRPIVTGQNPSDNVLVDWDVKSQGNLLSNSRTAPAGIALLCLDNGFNESFGGTFWAGPPFALWWEEQAILSGFQSLVEAQESRWFQYDGWTEEAGGVNEESTQTGNQAIRRA